MECREYRKRIGTDMRKIVETGEGGLSFLELLLDETLCAGKVCIPGDLVKQAGGINPVLKAGEKYELLLRIAEKTHISFRTVTENEPVNSDKYVVFEDDDPRMKACYGWETDCYIASKYSIQLQEYGVFDEVIEAILLDAEKRDAYDETVRYLEMLMKKGREYYRIDDMTKPVLIYKGDDICHNVLTVFAEQFGAALEQEGKNVIYFDMGKEPIESVTRYINQHFCAIIGVQSYMFSIKLKDETEYLHQYIYGPKFNFIFDHPIWLKNHLQHHLDLFCVLTHDSDYVNFVHKYFKMDAVLFPPAGIEIPGIEEKKYDLTFVGTYNDYRSQLPVIHQMNRSMRFFANHLLLLMRKNASLSAEEAFNRTVEEQGVILTQEEYLNLFYEMRRVFYCVIHYYREKILRIIINGDIKIDLFGDSWKESAFYSHPNVRCHPDITVEESITVWKRSKLSLNIMSWHKAGFTERMANIMLAGAVLVTDDSTYLRGRYDENDMLIFKLDQCEKLPQRIAELLADDEKQRCIAQNGKKKTRCAHTWGKRAQEFLELLNNR